MATVTAQGSLFKITQLIQKLPTANDIPAPISTRGDVVGFSRKSRKRLMDLMARLDRDVAASFITLTYGQNFPDCHQSKIHLHNFARRIQRHSPQSAVIWRMELQDREAPHYHLILTNPAYLDKDDLANWWLDTIGSDFADKSQGYDRPPFTQIRYVPPGNKSKVLAYVSKYVAKSTQSLDDAHALDQSSGGFNNVPYLTTFGRVWGVYGRKNLPFAELSVITHRPNSPYSKPAHRHSRSIYASQSVTKFGMDELKRLGGNSLNSARGVASYLFPSDDWIYLSNTATFNFHAKKDNHVYTKTLNDIKRLLRSRHKKNFNTLRDRIIKKTGKFNGSYRSMKTSPDRGCSLYVDNPERWLDAYYYFWTQHLSKIDF